MEQKKFVTADLHLNHNKPFIYQKRGFTSVKEMDDVLIDNWNGRVGKSDLVYVVGDFAFVNTVSEFKSYMDRLNGEIIVISGSHDKIVYQYKNRFRKIHEKLNTQINGQDVTMIHECPKVWHKSHHGSWACVGHSHGGMNEYMENEGKLLDCGVDSYNLIFGGFYPFEWDEIVSIMKTRPMNFNDLKKN